MTWKLFWLLVEAARLTILLSVVSIGIFGFLIGVLVCAGMLSPNRWAPRRRRGSSSASSAARRCSCSSC